MRARRNKIRTQRGLVLSYRYNTGTRLYLPRFMHTTIVWVAQYSDFIENLARLLYLNISHNTSPSLTTAQQSSIEDETTVVLTSFDRLLVACNADMTSRHTFRYNVSLCVISSTVLLLPD